MPLQLSVAPGWTLAALSLQSVEFDTYPVGAEQPVVVTVAEP